ncbi:MAG: TolC family protein [Gammaproteobacteria bacterium]|nr:TolC family protein [Gammaproteobacteria bacterium]MDH3561839.1 TolC family protein [Gammaproteobacteria bacterium]
MWQHFVAIIILCWVHGVGTVLAAESFNLDRAVGYALEHNPDLLTLRARSEAATARTQTAVGERLPSLGLSYMARASNNPLDAFADKLNTRRVTTPDFDPARLNHPGTSDLHATQLAMRLPVYSGGRLTASVTGAEATEQNARLEYERAREVTAFQTLRAYVALQSAQEELAIVDDAVKAAEEHAYTTAQLARAGRIVISDKLTAEVNLSAVQSRREQAVTRLASARNQLKLVMGLPLDSEIELTPARLDIEPFPASSLPDSEARALASRKDLAASRALSQAIRSRVQAARAVQKPRVDLIATTNWYDDNPGFDAHSSSVMGVVSLDLYAGGRHQGEIGAALAEERAAHWRVQSLEQAVRNEVRETHENLREGHARHTRAIENVERARENVRLIKQRYGQGRTILIDLLQAERSYTETRQEELISRHGLLVGQAAQRLAEGTLAIPSGTAP